jgi:hypothetical protein
MEDIQKTLKTTGEAGSILSAAFRLVILITLVTIVWLIVSSNIIPDIKSSVFYFIFPIVCIIVIITLMLGWDFLIYLEYFIHPLSNQEDDDRLERKIQLRLPYDRVFALCLENLKTNSWHSREKSASQTEILNKLAGYSQVILSFFRPREENTLNRGNPPPFPFYTINDFVRDDLIQSQDDEMWSDREIGRIEGLAGHTRLYFFITAKGTSRTQVIVRASYSLNNIPGQLFSYPIQRRRKAIWYLERIRQFLGSYNAIKWEGEE